MRVNVKLLLFLVFGLVFIATWSLWNRCLDGLRSPGWDNNFKHNGDGPLQVILHSVLSFLSGSIPAYCVQFYFFCYRMCSQETPRLLNDKLVNCRDTKKLTVLLMEM